MPIQIRESKSCSLPQRELTVTITGNAIINIGKGFELQRFGGWFFPIINRSSSDEGARWRVRVYLAFAKGKCKRDEVEENSARVFKR